MNKVPITKTALQALSTPTKDVIDKASPLIKRFAEIIMGYYSPEEPAVFESEGDKTVQALFDKWPKDDTTLRLAELTEAIYGYKPVVKDNKTIKFGELIKYNSDVYVTVHSDSNSFYVASVNGANCLRLYPNNAINKVTAAEAGIFVKEFLKVKPSILLTTLGKVAISIVLEFLEQVGDNI
jgi:hypothetical protein